MALLSVAILGLIIASVRAGETGIQARQSVIGPVADLHIINANIAPDGFTRSAVLPEGTFPGPLIMANKGDHFKINVINQLTDSSMAKTTSIHWHGLFQKHSNWADGPSFVNQCPIAPGNSFLYEFDVPAQSGSYWYHSHLQTQYCDGLRGALILYDPDDPYAHMYDVDDGSTVITLADWYHQPAPLLAKLPPPPKPAATLINGKGRYKNGPATPLAVISVEQGKRYRFRIIAMSCEPGYAFSIDDHDMTVIETDGEYTEPHTVDSIELRAAQRYSVIVNATQAVSNYWIRSDPSTGDAGFDDGMNLAIMRYVGAPEQDPTTFGGEDFAAPLFEQDLHALENPGAPGEHHIDGADVNINMIFGFDRTTNHFSINGATWLSPSVPVLLQILSGKASATDLLPSGSVYPLPLNKVIQLTFSPANASNAGGPHPFHLHGHSFDVIRSAGSDVYNWENPVRRDVVSTGSIGDNVTIRFVTDNSGPWFLHCHIDWHLEEGFAVVLAEDVPGTASNNYVPDAWKELCPIYNQLTPDQLGAQ